MREDTPQGKPRQIGKSKKHQRLSRLREKQSLKKCKMALPPQKNKKGNEGNLNKTNTQPSKGTIKFLQNKTRISVSAN